MSFFTIDKSISSTSVVCELKHLLTNVLGKDCNDIVNGYIFNPLTSICTEIEVNRQIEKLDRQQARIMKFNDYVHFMSYDDAQDEYYRVYSDSEDDDY
jgi:hypothetical protein